MTEQELKEIRKTTDRWYEDDDLSFRQSCLYDNLIDDVDKLRSDLELERSEHQLTAYELNELTKLINSHAPEGRNYTNGQYVWLLLENERLRKALELIIKNTVSGHVENIARKALEDKNEK